jgi:glycine cleavage system H lipoate-binding protein
MKEVRGAIWFQTSEDGTVTVGLTWDYIRQKLGECFHVMQADERQLIQNQPMLVLETNDGLETIKAPVSGTIVHFNWRARDFPDKLTEEETILIIKPTKQQQYNEKGEDHEMPRL